MPDLKISADLSLPLEAATWVISYLAKRGAGKTYDAAVQAEEMLKAGIPIVVVDGMGIWWGLRVSADGKSPGLPVVVFGGEHADLPLVPEKAAEMAKAIVESNISCVLDLSQFSKLVARRIVRAFLDELYHLNRVVRHVYIEESDMFGPQKTIGPEEALCLSSVDNFVRRGGNHNLGCTLITQRSAVLNKDILTQSDCLVVLRILAPQDKKAIQAWVEEQTDEDKTELNKWYDSLKELQNGEAWVWHPEKPDIFKKVMFRLRETFHATREFIRSPQASKIVLMGVDEFVERFKKVFTSLAPLAGPVGVMTPNAATMKELEEYRSGSKLAESVQTRLKFQGEMSAKLSDEVTRLQKELSDLEPVKRLRDDLIAVLPMTKVVGPEAEKLIAEFKKISEDVAKREIAKLAAADQQVGLQLTTTVVNVPPSEKRVTINTESMRGKILTVAKKGKLDTWRQLGEIVKAVEEEHWNAAPADVNNALNDLAKENLIAKKHTDRNYYCLAQNVVFEGKEVVSQ